MSSSAIICKKHRQSNERHSVRHEETVFPIIQTFDSEIKVSEITVEVMVTHY